MPKVLKEAFAHAETAFVEGRYTEALKHYLAVVQGAPTYTRARYRIADTLLNLGDRNRAKDVYKNLAWHYIKAGHPLLGLVCCKMVLALDPNYTDLLYILAELYSSESDRGTEDKELFEVPPLSEDVLMPPLSELEGAALIEESARVAADTDRITSSPAKLPLIPLFSQLSEDAFIRVLGSLRLRRHTNGERIVAEGESGDSFFMLADGVVVVSKNLNGRDTVLANLKPGAVFGEMALVAHARRAATVSALGDVDLLELSRHDIEGHAGELESVKLALRKFTRGRFLANLTATSPLFRPLSKPARRALVAQFDSRKIHPGDIVIEEGEAGTGLFLVLRGELEVSRKGVERPVALLRGTDVFGEISLLNEAPTTATVTATSPGEVLFLPKGAFHEMLKAHPEVRASLDSLSEERIRQLKGQVGSELITDDSEVML